MRIHSPAMPRTRSTAPGRQAIVSASQGILLGDYDVAIGGGAENMSRAPYASLATRFGARMGDSKMVDMMVGALHDPFHTIHMGVTAENVAAEHGITRADQDALALLSHQRAEKARGGTRALGECCGRAGLRAGKHEAVREEEYEHRNDQRRVVVHTGEGEQGAGDPRGCR